MRVFRFSMATAFPWPYYPEWPGIVCDTAIYPIQSNELGQRPRCPWNAKRCVWKTTMVCVYGVIGHYFNLEMRFLWIRNKTNVPNESIMSVISPPQIGCPYSLGHSNPPSPNPKWLKGRKIDSCFVSSYIISICETVRLPKWDYFSPGYYFVTSYYDPEISEI